MEIDEVLSDRVAHTAIPALAVGMSRDRKRTFAHGRQAPVTESSRYRIASLTKPFTSAATILALAERSIPLSTPAIDLLPSLAPDWKADRTITVEQLLGQVAGLQESVDGAAVAAVGDEPDAVHEAARLVVQFPNQRPPGERWSYYNGNYFLVGAILSALTGASYEKSLTHTLLNPWALTRTGFATPSVPVTGWDGDRPLPVENYPRGRRPSGGLWSCVGDLLTFAENLLDNPRLLQETRQARTLARDPMAYGLGWALGPSGQMYLNGRLAGYRSAILLVPHQGFASVALANQTHALPEIARLLSDLQYPLTGDTLARQIDAFAA